MDLSDVKKEIFERVEEAGHLRNQVVISIMDVNGYLVIGYQPEKIYALCNSIDHKVEHFKSHHIVASNF